jgi:signal peptidase II
MSDDASTRDPRAEAGRRFEPALRASGAWVTLIVSIALALGADLGSKRWAFGVIAGQPVAVDRAEVLAAGPSRLQGLVPPHAPRVVVPHVLNLELVLNAGAVFGAGQGRRWLFIGFTFVALGFALWMFARWTAARDHLSHVCIGLIIAGGLGNLYDRLRYACVRDFLHPLPTANLPFGWRWPGGGHALWPYVSNVADAFLIIGIGVLILRLWRTPPGR